MKPNDLPSDIDERLREWGAYFKDRRILGRCGSIESRFKPHSLDFAAEGWGDQENAPTPPPRPRNWILRAMQTQDAMSEMSKSKEGRRYAWALTYHYAYPSLPKFVVLRCMKKYTGRHTSWKQFFELVDIGRFRVWTLTAAYPLRIVDNGYKTSV